MTLPAPCSGLVLSPAPLLSHVGSCCFRWAGSAGQCSCGALWPLWVWPSPQLPSLELDSQVQGRMPVLGLGQEHSTTFFPLPWPCLVTCCQLRAAPDSVVVSARLAPCARAQDSCSCAGGMGGVRDSIRKVWGQARSLVCPPAAPLICGELSP